MSDVLDNNRYIRILVDESIERLRRLQRNLNGCGLSETAKMLQPIETLMCAIYQKTDMLSQAYVKEQLNKAEEPRENFDNFILSALEHSMEREK